MSLTHRRALGKANLVGGPESLDQLGTSTPKGLTTMGTMTETHTNTRDALTAFADELEAAGFRVYRPGGTWEFIGFAREIDGKWCSATVQASDFGNSEGWSWNMNIVPSREDGSSMFLDDVPNGSPLTVETARSVTRPAARNAVLSRRRENAGWPNHWSSAISRDPEALGEES